MQKRILKILVVDDEMSIRDSIKFHLEDLGFEVVAAEDPTLCPVYSNCKCSEESPCADVIFIDQNMPNMTGAEFIKMQQERGCKLHPSFKLIMTGAVTEEVAVLAEKLGCRLVQKPLALTDAEAFVLQVKKAKE